MTAPTATTRPNALCPNSISGDDGFGSGMMDCVEAGCAVWTRHGCGLTHSVTEHRMRGDSFDEAARIADNTAAGKEPF